MIAGRPRDLEDVKTLLLKNPAYDRGYITHWLTEFDTSLGAHYCKSFEDIAREGTSLPGC